MTGDEHSLLVEMEKAPPVRLDIATRDGRTIDDVARVLLKIPER